MMITVALGTLSGCASVGNWFSSISSPFGSAKTVPSGGGAIPSNNTVALDNQTKVTADTRIGRITVEAGPGLRRIFDWDGMRRGVITKARKHPFGRNKTKGITFNGTPKPWPPANGITKVRYEEGYLNFENASDALIWMQIRRLNFIHNDSGLAVGWAREGDTLHVEVWQITINNKKPTKMPKSQDSRITVSQV